MAAIDSLGLTFACASSAADAFHEATQKAMASYLPHPELALSIKAGLIAIVFLTRYFQQESMAWARFIDTFSSPDFLIAWAVAGSVNVTANFFMILGMRRGQISDTVPFLSLSPMFLLASGYIFLDEIMESRGMLGVLTVAVGGLWLSRVSVSAEDGKPDGKPMDRGPSVKRLSSQANVLPPGAGIYIFIAMIQSISSAFDKRGVRAAAAPELYGATISSTVSVCAFCKFAWQKLSKTICQQHRSAAELAPASAPKLLPKVAMARDVLAGLGLTSIACALKMVAYWCQLQASQRMYSAHLSAIRKSGVLLVLLLGRVLFNEEVGRKWLPVSTMILGIGLLSAL
jgi:drug/metabolite transporter (DMT)-like permease